MRFCKIIFGGHDDDSGSSTMKRYNLSAHFRPRRGCLARLHSRRFAFLLVLVLSLVITVFLHWRAPQRQSVFDGPLISQPLESINTTDTNKQSQKISNVAALPTEISQQNKRTEDDDLKMVQAILDEIDGLNTSESTIFESGRAPDEAWAQDAQGILQREFEALASSDYHLSDIICGRFQCEVLLDTFGQFEDLSAVVEEFVPWPANIDIDVDESTQRVSIFVSRYPTFDEDTAK